MKKYYCCKCGKKMILEKRFQGYNKENGEKIYDDIYHCPKAKFWNFHETDYSPFIHRL